MAPPILPPAELGLPAHSCLASLSLAVDYKGISEKGKVGIFKAELWLHSPHLHARITRIKGIYRSRMPALPGVKAVAEHGETACWA